MKHAVGWLLSLLCLSLGLAQAQPVQVRLYTPEQVAQMSVGELLARLGHPEEGYQPNAARIALVLKAKADEATRQKVISGATQAVKDAGRVAYERCQAMYVLAALGDAATVSLLAGVLTSQEGGPVRCAAAAALGQMDLEEARQALKQAQTREQDAEVLKWIERGLQAKPTVAADAQNPVRFWLVKDWLRLRNTGPAVTAVDFQRHFPVVDDEQIVLGRWVEACDGKTRVKVPVALLRVDADGDQNLIHTFRLDGMQPNQEITVTTTAVVARHAKAPPKPPCMLVKAEEYPEWARPYLQATPTVPADDPVVRQQAQLLLAKTQDAYEIVTQIIEMMKKLPSPPSQRWTPQQTLSIPAFVLKYGGLNNQAAVTCAALCRACGIPAQLTYYPAQSLMAVVDVFLPGYGWFRVQPVFAAAFVPQAGFAPPRVLNLPIEAETHRDRYMQPYHTQVDGSWQVYSGGQPNGSIRSWSAVENGKAVQIDEGGIPHYECGTVMRGLGVEPFEGDWAAWDDLTKLSMEQMTTAALGAFTGLAAKAPAVKAVIERGLTYKEEKQN